MELKFTQHPILSAPTDEEIVMLADEDPRLLRQLFEAHEGRIQAAEEDPIRHGFDLEGWQRVREGLEIGRASCRGRG